MVQINQEPRCKHWATTLSNVHLLVRSHRSLPRSWMGFQAFLDHSEHDRRQFPANRLSQSMIRRTRSFPFTTFPHISLDVRQSDGVVVKSPPENTCKAPPIFLSSLFFSIFLCLFSSPPPAVGFPFPPFFPASQFVFSVFSLTRCRGHLHFQLQLRISKIGRVRPSVLP